MSATGPFHEKPGERTLGGVAATGVMGNHERTPLDECARVYESLDEVGLLAAPPPNRGPRGPLIGLTSPGRRRAAPRPAIGVARSVNGF